MESHGFELGKHIIWHILVIQKTPSDEIQVAPVVGLAPGNHEFPVRNFFTAEIQSV